MTVSDADLKLPWGNDGATCSTPACPSRHGHPCRQRAAANGL